MLLKTVNYEQLTESASWCSNSPETKNRRDPSASHKNFHINTLHTAHYTHSLYQMDAKTDMA
jgi:hypothetical protein